MKTTVVHPMDTEGDPDLACEVLSLTTEKHAPNLVSALLHPTGRKTMGKPISASEYKYYLPSLSGI